MPIIELTEDNYDEVVKNSMVLIDFSATWCGPCKQMKPHLERVEKSMSESGSPIKFAVVDVDDQQDLAINYKVKCMPTLVFTDNGKLVQKSEGFLDEQKISNFVSKCQAMCLVNNQNQPVQESVKESVTVSVKESVTVSVRESEDEPLEDPEDLPIDESDEE